MFINKKDKEIFRILEELEDKKFLIKTEEDFEQFYNSNNFLVYLYLFHNSLINQEKLNKKFTKVIKSAQNKIYSYINKLLDLLENEKINEEIKKDIKNYISYIEDFNNSFNLINLKDTDKNKVLEIIFPVYLNNFLYDELLEKFNKGK
jgi:hypothetical protein